MLVARPVEEMLLSKILHLVAEAQEAKAKFQRRIEQFEQWYAIVVIAGAIIAAAVLRQILYSCALESGQAAVARDNLRIALWHFYGSRVYNRR